MSADGGRREKEKEEQHRGRVAEKDRAAGEGESEDSCADHHPFLTFTRTRKVSEDERSGGTTVRAMVLKAFGSYLPVIRSWQLCLV